MSQLYAKVRLLYANKWVYSFLKRQNTKIQTINHNIQKCLTQSKNLKEKKTFSCLFQQNLILKSFSQPPPNSKPVFIWYSRLSALKKSQKKEAESIRFRSVVHKTSTFQICRDESLLNVLMIYDVCMSQVEASQFSFRASISLTACKVLLDSISNEILTICDGSTGSGTSMNSSLGSTHCLPLPT